MIRRLLVAVSAVLVVIALAYGMGRIAIRQREPTDLREIDPPGRLVEVAGSWVHLVERGQGEPLILLHGLGRSTVDWEQSVLDLLARDRRVIAIDLLGMGFSERSDDFAYGWTLWSEQVVSLLDALGVARADVVGHSLGGTVAVLLAARHPERVRRIVLMGSARSVPGYFVVWLVPGLGEIVLGSVEQWGEERRFSESHPERTRLAWSIRGTRRALIRYTRCSALEMPGLLAAFEALSVPVLQIHGTHDEEVPLESAMELHEGLPTSGIVVIEGGTHYSMFDSPACVVDELQRFLDAPDERPWPQPRERIRRCERSTPTVRRES